MTLINRERISKSLSSKPWCGLGASQFHNLLTKILDTPFRLRFGGMLIVSNSIHVHGWRASYYVH